MNFSNIVNIIKSKDRQYKADGLFNDTGTNIRCPYEYVFMVPRAGLEPAQAKRSHGPQPCVSANSTTSANEKKLYNLIEPLSTTKANYIHLNAIYFL